MKRKGIRSTVDVNKLAAAVSRPGIDPRTWITLAQVTDVTVDVEKGIYADVVLIPDGDIETCNVGSDYAGDGFGKFVPPKIGDIVLVVIPGGDTGFGPVIMSRLFNGVAKPPTDFQNPDSLEPEEAVNAPVLVVEPLKTYKVVANEGAGTKIEIDGSGKVEIEATGQAEIVITGESVIIINSGDVRLGPSAGNALARIGDIVIGSVPPMVAGIIPITPVPPVTPTSTGGIPFTGQIVSGQAAVKA